MSRAASTPAAFGIFAIFAILPLLMACSNEDGSLRAVPNSDNQAAPMMLQRGRATTRLQLDNKTISLAAALQLVPKDAKSLLRLPGRIKSGEYVWNDTGVPTGTLLIWIDLERQLISVFRAGHEIGTSVFIYGAGAHSTPLGQFSILRKDQDYHSRSYDAPMPYAMFITKDGVALHGSPQAPERATHGCIGLPEAFAKMIFDNSSVGDEVTIVKSERGLNERVSSRPLQI